MEAARKGDLADKVNEDSISSIGPSCRRDKVCRSQKKVETAKENDEKGKRPGRMHLQRITELHLQGGFDDEQKGAVVK